MEIYIIRFAFREQAVFVVERSFLCSGNWIVFDRETCLKWFVSNHRIYRDVLIVKEKRIEFR